VQLNKYYVDNLENNFPDFAAIMDEYRGLLLFDLMEKKSGNALKPIHRAKEFLQSQQSQLPLEEKAGCDHRFINRHERDQKCAEDAKSQQHARATQGKTQHQRQGEPDDQQRYF
jgi:hypothetical protein